MEKDKERKIKEDTRITEATKIILSTINLDEKGAVKKYLIENAIDNFYTDIDAATSQIIFNKRNYQFNEDDGVVNIIQRIFIASMDRNMKDFEIERLKNPQAVSYYNNYLRVLQKQALNERINGTTAYCKRKQQSNDPKLYIGTAYGEEQRYSPLYTNAEYHNKVYVDLTKKSDEDIVNLAIVKLKMEEDFVTFKLNKLIVGLHDFGIIPDDYYNFHVYGTTDMNLINLVQYGLGVNVVKKLRDDDQIRHLALDRNGNLTADPLFHNYLGSQSDLFQFEINKYLR